MYRTALIALDHSAAQGPLLECLTDLCEMGVSLAILTHVVKVGYAQSASYGHEDALKDWLSSRAMPLRHAGLDVGIDIRAAGDLGKDILAAAEHAADLIVIGSRGQNMIRGLFLGSVAREVIRLSTLPVRLEWIEATGRDGDAACERSCHAGLRRVLLATDFSPQARAAEVEATELAPHAGVVDILHVVSPDERARFAHWPVMARAALDVIAREIAAVGGRAEVHMAEGKPADEIAREAAARDTDLVIVGKHGQNWAEGVAVGSTVANLCEIALRPALMVPLGNEKA